MLLTVKEQDKYYWVKYNVLEMNQIFLTVHKMMLEFNQLVHTIRMLVLLAQHVRLSLDARWCRNACDFKSLFQFRLS